MITELFLHDPVLFSLMALFALTVLVQLIYYWVFYSAVAFSGQSRVHENAEGVSVVICAKDEYHNLQRNLPHILEQQYPNFEVVVVNDKSNDESELLLESLARQYDHLQIVHVNSNLNFFKGKKFPQSVGIRSARYENILFTDANCRPASAYWIRRMMSVFTKETNVVLGYHALEKGQGLLNTLIRYDHLTNAVRYLSFAGRGIPFNGSIKNILFRKELFYKQNSFIGLYNMRAGDDEKFINKAVGRKGTKVQLHPESHIITFPKQRYRTWVNIKKRQKAGTHFFRFPHKLLLGLFVGSQYLFFGLFAALMITQYMVLIAGGLFLLREISHLIVFKNSMKRLKEQKLLLFSLIGEIYILLISPYLWLGGRTTKTGKWR
ncbi:MAG: hypothetical protein C0593_01805 [Marinilabiliales bacterium]|nr:MAG: hypothetical protein C0593_01805 [Marinilabiliales bacterium]